MGAILEYKCPCCSGPLQFDTDAQKMKCPYCDNEFDAETLKSNDDILKEEKARYDGLVKPARQRVDAGRA